MKFSQQMVNSETIKDESITSADIKNGEIVDADISASAAIAKSKLDIPTVDSIILNHTYCFAATTNAAQSVPHNTNTQLQFEDEEYDPAGVFDAVTTFKFTAPCAGVWHFDACVLLDAGGGWETGEQFGISLVKNTNTTIGNGMAQYAPCNNQNYQCSAISRDVKLAAGDTVWVRAFQNSDGAILVLNDGTYTYFNGHWVSDG